jgi:hypothetical protein
MGFLAGITGITGIDVHFGNPETFNGGSLLLGTQIDLVSLH